MKKPKPPVVASNTFYCPTCDQTMDGAPAFKEHLASVHSITDIKGTKRMRLHLDCADSYHSEYELEIAGLQFLQSTTNPRHKNDMMRHT